MFQKITLPSFSGSGGQIRIFDRLTLKMKALQTFEKPGTNHPMTQCSIPGDLNHWVRNGLSMKQRAIVCTVENRKTT
jgi:hypothetical protein